MCSHGLTWRARTERVRTDPLTDPTPMTSLPKAPPPNTILLEGGFQHRNLGTGVLGPQQSAGGAAPPSPIRHPPGPSSGVLPPSHGNPRAWPAGDAGHCWQVDSGWEPESPCCPHEGLSLSTAPESLPHQQALHPAVQVPPLEFMPRPEFLLLPCSQGPSNLLEIFSLNSKNIHFCRSLKASCFGDCPVGFRTI